MSRFSLRIELGNDAMQTPEEVAAALRIAAARVRAGEIAGTVRDLNGNTVGEWELEPEEDEEG